MTSKRTTRGPQEPTDGARAVAIDSEAQSAIEHTPGSCWARKQVKRP